MKLRRKSKEAPIPYVPMADLGFNLVLFFIIMAKTSGNEIPWGPAKAADTREVARSSVAITVDKDAKVYLGNDQIGIRDLTENVNRLLGDTPAEKRIVLLRVHKDTPAATFEPILEAVSQAGGEVVHVLQQEQ